MSTRRITSAFALVLAITVTHTTPYGERDQRIVILLQKDFDLHEIVRFVLGGMLAQKLQATTDF